MTYQEYLKTDYWKERSAAFKKSTHQRCFICRKRHCRFNVHHKRYERKGKSIWFHERDTDLRLLCGTCHKVIHEHRLEEVLMKMLFKRKVLLAAISSGNPRDYLEGCSHSLSPRPLEQYNEWKIKTALQILSGVPHNRYPGVGTGVGRVSVVDRRQRA